MRRRFVWRRACNRGADVAEDLSDARIVDTEAPAALWQMQNDGRTVTLYDPPDLFQGHDFPRHDRRAGPGRRL
jgi:hypothetical protein